MSVKERPAKRANPLERKQAIIDRLGLDTLQQDYDYVLSDLEARLANRTERQNQVNAGKQLVEEIKAMVYLNGAIDGKNEAQRAAQLTLAIRDNPDYRAAKASLDTAETALEVNTQEIETARRRMDAIKIKLRLGAATLELLAS